MQKILIVGWAALLVGGCAANSGVLGVYGDVLSVSRQGETGFSSPSGIRAEALAEAQGHCTSLGRAFYLVALNENEPPFLLGNFPRAEVQFMCLDPADPRLRDQRQ